MKRRWFAAVARELFARSAMSAPRDDAKSSHRVAWMYNAHNEKSYSSSDWGVSVRDHYENLFISKRERLDEKRLRLKDLGEKCFLSHSDSSHSWVELPMHSLLDARHRMASNNAPGADRIVHEMFFHLPWEALDAIRHAFGQRLNCVPGHTGLIPEWQDILVKCIPKVAVAHRPTAWRSLSVVSVLQKWYMTTATCAISRILPPWTCDMYGFLPGEQTGEVYGNRGDSASVSES